MSADDRMREVELVEVARTDERGRNRPADHPGTAAGPEQDPWSAPGDADDADEADDPRVPRRLGALARRWWPLALLVVVAVVVTQLVLDARERSRLAALASVPGVLAPLDGPLEVLWRLDPTGPWQLYGTDRGDGVLVSPTLEPDGTRAVEAVDAGTGDVEWHTPIAAAGDADDDGEHGWWDLPSCALTTDDTPLAVCLVTDNEVIGSQSTGYQVTPISARLVTLDATSGELLADRDAPAPASFSLVDGAVVLAAYDTEGHVVVTASDPRSGAQRWTFRSPAGDPGVIGLEMAPTLEPDGDRVVVSMFPSGTWLLGPDGRVVLALQAEGDAGSLSVARGGEVVQRDGTTVTLLREDGTPRGTLPGDLLWLTADDGSLPGTVLLGASDGFTPRVTVVDAATAEVRWEGRGPVSGAALLDGVLYGFAGQQLCAVDGRTGEMLWETDVPAAVGSGTTLTDGRRVYATEDDGTGPDLVGYDLADGQESWRSPLPAGIDSVYVFDVRGRGNLIGSGMSGDTAVLGNRSAG